MVISNGAVRIFVSIVISALLLSGFWPESDVYSQAVKQGQAPLSKAADHKQSLKERYGLSIPDSLTKGDFIVVVAKILDLKATGHKIPFSDLQEGSPYYEPAAALYDKGIITQLSVNADRQLTQSNAVMIALKASGMKELAYTYSPEKTKRSLAKLRITGNNALSPQASQELAAAVDLGLLPADSFSSFSLSKPASGNFASMLLDRVITFHGQNENYLGRISDPDIFRLVNQAWLSRDIIEDKQLQSVVDTALKQKLVTGYNLKDSRYDPHFDPNLTLTYGHSNIVHALQLIGLLRSEGIDAKVQLEPKTSAFVYLKEWGPQDYKIVEDEDGTSIAYTKEYDLSFEFQNVEQKNDFQRIILKYAKKDSDNQTGLIADSWWQPLYFSDTAMQDYKIISNTKITSRNYYAQTFSLSNQTAAIAAGLKQLNPDIQLESYSFWVDEPFYRYLQGDYK
ncbi:hypothetical protein [Paenibacillus beijingensis]|uniref:SLH domain-containing protein n=1 Tax=Paenibacillus beijingensis TaxID=1126833 RepID=A0A0D5NKG2_9BACL|nr:hypothetical protein [Paenibacillus beijingensis]AJY75423.1 hypothetical protein VN24_13655 [Paenibacillus beijingensis]